MSTVGFKCSWMKEDIKQESIQQVEQVPPMIPGSAVSFVFELQMKIMQHQEFILSKSFVKMSNEDKVSVLEEYTFLVRALTTIQMPSEAVASGFQEYIKSDIGF